MNAVNIANIGPVPTTIRRRQVSPGEQTTELNKESLKHEGQVYCHLEHVHGVIKPYQVSDTEIECHIYALIVIAWTTFDDYNGSRKRHISSVEYTSGGY